jgi:hypothetical protein
MTYMNHTTRIRLAVIVIAVATLMISGTLFYPMLRKQQAYSVSSTRHQVESEWAADSHPYNKETRGSNTWIRKTSVLELANAITPM